MHALKSVFKHFIDPDQHWKLNLLHQWGTIIGPIGAYVLVEKIDDDTIVLSVTDSCWMQELYLLSDLLLKKINQNLDVPRIKHIRFRQSGIRKKKDASKVPVPPVVRAPKQVTLKLQERQALEKIKDPQLCSALKQFLIRCYQE